jgi:hypothetical protein
LVDDEISNSQTEMQLDVIHIKELFTVMCGLEMEGAIKIRLDDVRERRASRCKRRQSVFRFSAILG